MAHPKGALIERLQKEGRQPRFETRASGPDHEPVFDADVIVDGEVLGSGHGPNKRSAERRAAEEALAALDDAPAADAAGAVEEEPVDEEPVDDAPDAEPADVRAAEDADDEEDDEEPFEGPWPIFDDVLAMALRVAHERVDGELRDDAAREAIGAFALDLYKDVLQDLGDVVELDD